MNTCETAAVSDIALKRGLLFGVENVARRHQKHDDAIACERGVGEHRGVLARLDRKPVLTAEAADRVDPSGIDSWRNAAVFENTRTEKRGVSSPTAGRSAAAASASASSTGRNGIPTMGFAYRYSAAIRSQVNSRYSSPDALWRGGGRRIIRSSPAKLTSRIWSEPMREGSEAASTRVTSRAPSKV